MFEMNEFVMVIVAIYSTPQEQTPYKDSGQFQSFWGLHTGYGSVHPCHTHTHLLLCRWVPKCPGGANSFPSQNIAQLEYRHVLPYNDQTAILFLRIAQTEVVETTLI